MTAIYKIYAMILEERLRKEKKRIVPQNQIRFRKGIGTDNIHVLNYLINKQIGRKKGRLVTLFVDIIAAFDSVDRVVLTGNERKGD